MIITDSLSSLQALKSQKLNNPIVSNILHLCHYLSGHKDIVFCWVPSHIGIQGNERADVLAKAALDKTKQFLAPAVTVGETEGAMDSTSVFFWPLLLPITL